ncbi:MAG: hypothetical protein LBJ63_02840 [Prevotellaceae bacterium]|jgi:hypothetical protein|nr:hypothetical protein [Prevotellaceae bacterium]
MMAIVDLVGDIVARASEAVKKVIADETVRETGIFYQYGHLNDINNILKSYSNTAEYRAQKYPAVFLLQDFVETCVQSMTVEKQVNLQLLIVASSNRDYRAAERYEKVFKPVLYPVYDCLIGTIKRDKRLMLPYGDIEHTKIDRLLISGFQIRTQTGQTGNLFADFLDAIEINNMKLIIKKMCNYGL